jgi:hypothetical protein
MSRGRLAQDESDHRPHANAPGFRVDVETARLVGRAGYLVPTPRRP